MFRTSTPGEVVLQARPARSNALRRAWMLAHRWLGLGLAAVLVLAGLTGSLLVLLEPADEALNAQLFTVRETGPVSLAPAVQGLRARFPVGTSFVLRPPREPGESLRAIVRGSWAGTVFLHPSTGQELGRRGEGEGFFEFLFVLHSRLFAGDTGKAVLTLGALGYLVMLVSGLVLWWPARWRTGLTVRTGAGFTRSIFDLHRAGGALLGLVVGVSVATGAYMAWHPIAQWVSQATGQVPLPPPTVSPSAAAPVSLDTAVARAQALFPDGMVGYVQVPASDGSPLRVRLKLPDDPHPNGLTSVWLHPRSGEVLAARRWSALDPGTRAYSFIYPLHIGTLGGTPVLVATFVAGMLLTGYGVSGVWLWWRRRMRSTPSRQA